MSRGVIERDIVHQIPNKNIVDPVLRRRISLGARGRQSAEDGLHERALDGGRLDCLEGSRRSDGDGHAFLEIRYGKWIR
jgi:hypothetical protein